jgi:hypothetical protein
MARSAKTRSDKASGGTPETGTDIVDAEVVAETVADAGAAVLGEPEVVADATTVEPLDAVVTDEVARVETVEAEPAVETEPLAEVEPVREPEPPRQAEMRSEPPVPPPAPVVVQRVGFVPLVLGGVVAAGLGFAAGWQGFLPSAGDAEVETALTEQAARIEELGAAVAAIPAAPDMAPLQAEIAALRDDLAPLVERVGAIEARLDTLERAPANDGTLSATAIAAWQQDIDDLKAAVAAQAEQAAAITDAAASRDADLAGLQEAMAAQQAEMARMVEEAAQRLDAAQSTVAEIEEAATANATATLRRAAVASLQSAVDSGQPFAAVLADLTATGLEAPDALTGPAAEGVQTLTALRESFPEAARAALAAARSEGLAEDGGGGVMGFLRSQLDVRSVEPREGDDPDAVLSRAEAALRDARLSDALAEIATLPEVVRAPMTDWVAAAEARMAAVAALQSLAETLPAPETSN